MGMLMFHSMYVKVKLGRSWTRPSAFGMTCANVQSAREKSKSTTARQPKTVARRRLGRLLSRLIFASPIIISGEQGVRKRQVQLGQILEKVRVYQQYKDVQQPFSPGT